MEGPIDDRSNRYEAVASEHIARRHPSIGVSTVRARARSLSGTAVLDLGCGHGVPISIALVDDGFALSGIDASPTMVAAFRCRLPQAPVACEAVEDSRFFGRTFDGILAWGLVFLLPAESQRALFGRIGSALNPEGSFLFTSPARPSTWADALTGRQSMSLGSEVYRDVLSNAGLVVVREHLDEGGNHYYETVKR